jgi:hypothetical protein
MSLYNLLHGYEPTAAAVLDILHIDPSGIPRFRDAYLTYRDETQSSPVMVILTRTGGVNRTDFAEQNAALCALPGYIDNADDDFDSTFALFRYEVPPVLQALTMQHLSEVGAPLTLQQKTEQATGPDQTIRQRLAVDGLTEQLSAALTNGGGIIEV